jgi:hypothetical protein
VARGDHGIASFDRIGYGRNNAGVFRYAFDLIEFGGENLRRDPLAGVQGDAGEPVSLAAPGLRLNEHMDHYDDWPRHIAGNCAAQIRTTFRTAPSDGSFCWENVTILSIFVWFHLSNGPTRR